MKKIKRRRIFLIITPIIAVIFYISFNVGAICAYSKIDETKNCDVGIVLGAATYNNGVSEVYKQRLNHAIGLYEDGRISKIIVTGGKAQGCNNSDAHMAKLYLEENQIPSKDILLEETSAITQENLENSKLIMDDNKFQTALIISDPLHMKRSMLLSKDTGIDAFSSPTKSSAYKSLKTKIPFVVRETFFYIGYKWYRIFNN